MATFFLYGKLGSSLNHHDQAFMVLVLQLLCLVLLPRLILLTSSIKLFPEVPVVALVQGSAAAAAAAAAGAAAGRWELLLENAGIASMHTAVTHTNTVLLLDRRNVGRSNISLARTQQSIEGDSSAHSVIFSLDSNSVRPLTIFTDTWCSSGQFLADGTLVQTGGNLADNSAHVIRTFTPCEEDGVCDWVEIDSEQLVEGRWYATNQLLPDGVTSIVVGGHRVSSYEYVPKQDLTTWQLRLLLAETHGDDENRLYPFVHLLPDGNLFVFANRDSILLDYETNTVLRAFPTMPGFVARNYPASGSSVLLPLEISSDSGTTSAVTILICGGARPDAHQAPNLLEIPASDSCGSLTVGSTRSDAVDAEEPQWVMLVMPRRRVMGDMVLLPDGQVLIINGAMNGTAGWEDATAPCLEPVIFNPVTAAFEIQAATTRPRMYHSTANLLPDGRVLVAGSNTHVRYNFKAEFPTDLSLEVFLPHYLANEEFAASRPKFSRTQPPTTLNYGTNFRANIYLPDDQEVFRPSPPSNSSFELRLCNAPYTTHSVSMGQRQLRLPILQSWQARADRNNVFTVESMAPPTANLAPPGYYMLFPLYQSIPGAATWVQLS